MYYEVFGQGYGWMYIAKTKEAAISRRKEMQSEGMTKVYIRKKHRMSSIQDYYRG